MHIIGTAYTVISLPALLLYRPFGFKGPPRPEWHGWYMLAWIPCSVAFFFLRWATRCPSCFRHIGAVDGGWPCDREKEAQHLIRRPEDD